VHEVVDDAVYEWEGLKLSFIQTLHYHSNNELMPTYGLDISYKDKKFLITADTQFTPERFDTEYHDATIIFHDCETMSEPSGIHAHFNQLKTLPKEIKAKTWLYHYSDGALPDARSEGFLGFVRCGQVIDLK
jgi:ribonuclease BN (tRNA processing enzyme)